MQPDVIGGRYRVGREIGRGAMGIVWLCRDEMLQRDVAIKQVGLLPGESVTDSARALREARTSAALTHRNVVTVFDVVEDHEAIWLVMEYVPARSLKEIVDQDGPLDPARAADVGAQVAEGLAAAHALGTMHRDVKPGNVLVRQDGVAKISDFGIARTMGEPTLTQSGLLTGTPCYFSPELAEGSAPGPAADVWALGATIYAAVQGRPPYSPQQNPVAVLHQIATQQPPAPTRAGFLEPVLLRMLDRDPESRWSMADAAHSLRRLAQEHEAERTRAETLAVEAPSVRRRPDPVRSRPPAAAPSQRPRRNRRGLAGLLAAAVLLAAAGGGAYLLYHDGSGGSQDNANRGPSASASSSDAPSGSDDSGSDESGSESSASGSSGSSGSLGSSGSSGSLGSSGSSGSTGALAEQASFLRSYFGSAPGGSDAAWAQLGSRERTVGRASYDGFWGSISSATVSNVKKGSGSDTVEATIRYQYDSGRVVVERQRITLVRSGDDYLIDNDDVLSSRTVSQ